MQTRRGSGGPRACARGRARRTSAKIATTYEHVAEDPSATNAAGKHEEQAEERRQAALPLRWGISRSMPYEPARPVNPGNFWPTIDEVRVHVGRVADVRGDEAVERARNPSDDERHEPGDEHREVRREAPEIEPHEVRNEEQQPEEDREPRALEVVRDDELNRVLGEARVRLRDGRVRGRVAPGEEEVVATRLSAVAERVRGQVAEPTRGAPEDEAEEPGEERDDPGEAADEREAVREEDRRPADREAAAEERREEQRRDGEDEAEGAAPAALPRGRVDLEVDRVPGTAAEAGVRAGSEEDVRADVGRVADVAGREAVEARRQLAVDDDGEPVHEGDEADRDPPERDPEDVRDREQPAEEDGQPAPAQFVVADDEADRTAFPGSDGDGHAPHSARSGRTARARHGV